MRRIGDDECQPVPVEESAHQRAQAGGLHGIRHESLFAQVAQDAVAGAESRVLAQVAHGLQRRHHGFAAIAVTRTSLFWASMVIV